VDVSVNVNERFVFTDAIVGDKARRARLSRLQAQGRRGVDVTQRRTDLRQKSSLRLFHIFGRDAFVKGRLLKARSLQIRKPQCLRAFWEASELYAAKLAAEFAHTERQHTTATSTSSAELPPLRIRSRSA